MFDGYNLPSHLIAANTHKKIQLHYLLFTSLNVKFHLRIQARIQFRSATPIGGLV
ncbi:hypothetical protein NSMM_310004 [Nitrosomonas mobilis]|uniref:Uncharacterized protein n=1 Tax=Nitrosomonas mobilis TaxID=51642 RepID=A0A1G5SCQ0_9PROT|nr:hypothetical protein NSMM_310004 [Nitrosomonas mobilis]